MKELLKITHIKEDICRLSCNIENDDEFMQLTATLLGAISKGDDNPLKMAIFAAVSAYLENDEQELENVSNKSEINLPLASSKHAS